MRCQEPDAVVEDFESAAPGNGYVFELLEVARCLRLGRAESSMVPWQATTTVAGLARPVAGRRPFGQAGRSGMRELEGALRHYMWGSTDVIPDLLGIEPTGEPFAEIVARRPRERIGLRRRGTAARPADPLPRIAG